ncbi:MAG: terminase small subunit, partial [Plesiomonas shigelloides]
MAFTIKKQNFARKVVELDGNQSAAYRAVYNCENMKPETIAKRASELMRDGDVAGMIAQLRQRAAKRHDCTVDSLVAELEEIKQVALAAETPQTSAAVSAVMGKAKLCGLDKQ